VITTIAQIILVRPDGALILQLRDDKPGIVNPGLVAAFGGGVEEGETPLQAAVRELREETTLDLPPSRFESFGLYHKVVAGRKEACYYYIVRDVDEAAVRVLEGQGYVIAAGQKSLAELPLTVLLREVLADYYAAPR
jgi:8-oxo-dGTP pyrophosphatase MutT (NUDIX family)